MLCNEIGVWLWQKIINWIPRMARTSKGSKRKQAQAVKAVATSTPSTLSRRTLMRWAGVAVGGAVLMGAGGAWAVSSFKTSVEERDLSRVGQGQPTIVQIHDPQCPICNALQRETRAALKRLGAEKPVYLIADLTQTEGAMFAQRHSVPHVTLLLFDAAGNRLQTLSGSKTRDELEPIFAQHTR
jgi:hypothetical protein